MLLLAEHDPVLTAKHLAAMRTLWADDVASFRGEFTRFDAVRANPKPVRGRRNPVVVGGNSELAPELAEAGVTETVLVGTPPADPAGAAAWVAGIAAAWLDAGRVARRG